MMAPMSSAPRTEASTVAVYAFCVQISCALNDIDRLPRAKLTGNKSDRPLGLGATRNEGIQREVA